MTIGAGWVGSNAVNETGQRWMSAAASVVRLGTPFWMSQLVGRSKFDFEIYVDNQYISNRRYYGWKLSNPSFGSLNFGNMPGYNMLGIYGTNSPDSGIINIQGSPNRSFILRAQDGTTWQFDRTSDVAHTCTDGGRFYNWIGSKAGQNIGFNLIN